MGDLVARVREWTGSALTDDVALLVAEVLGPGSPASGRRPAAADLADPVRPTSW
ncbi:hypothetical protein FRAHR75_160075 [Frankia sp. Hr75.2]|nr:hypothetical protein FRAHR75_160075 [Frankia sp. Hr75.2]